MDKIVDAPPSYNESVAGSMATHQAQLLRYSAMMSGTIRHSQEDHRLMRDEQDLGQMARIVPEVGSFMAYVAALPTQPRRAELVLVPDHAVSIQWTLSGSEEQRKEGDVVRVARIRGDDIQPEKKATQYMGDETATREFDDWGRWADPESADCGSARDWWHDEEMAQRLAHSLSPTTGKVPRAKDGSIGGEISVGMAARAEEVTFRRENELGIYESRTGWGIVVWLTWRR